MPGARPDYPALLRHPWLKSIEAESDAIKEEPEEEEEAAAAGTTTKEDSGVGMAADRLKGLELEEDHVYDPVVAKWVREALERKEKGESDAGATRPALHAAPLDQVSPGVRPGAQW